MIEGAVFVVALLLIAKAMAMMLRANRLYAASVKEIAAVAAKPKELAALKAQVTNQIAEQKREGERLAASITRHKQEKVHLAEELDRLRNRRKDNLFAMERASAPGQPLWEVVVCNETYFRDCGEPEFVLSWAEGRRYLVAAPSERDARKRAELKFLPSQGYRVLGIERCSRF